MLDLLMQQKSFNCSTKFFSNLHKAYVDKKDAMFDGDRVSRESFMHILSEIWDTWTTNEFIIKATRRVGITSTGINVQECK